ncbi:hypothetical protein ACFE04_021668 [Oxalis oulophora]
MTYYKDVQEEVEATKEKRLLRQPNFASSNCKRTIYEARGSKNDKLILNPRADTSWENSRLLGITSQSGKSGYEDDIPFFLKRPSMNHEDEEEEEGFVGFVDFWLEAVAPNRDGDGDGFALEAPNKDAPVLIKDTFLLCFDLIIVIIN